MNFYNNRENLKRMISIINGESKISLRIVDWFVTNFAKKNFTVYDLSNHLNEPTRFKVYHDYKLKLKAYSKKLFDPFCRRERISFQIPGHEAFLTTVGKLNFFRWALEKGILGYIKGNQPEIEKEMNAAMKEQTKQRTTPSTRDSVQTTQTVQTAQTGQSGQTQTRKRIANREPAAIKLLQKHECQIELRFD